MRAANALTAPVLGAVQVGLGALRVAAAGDRDDHFLVRHQVLDGQVAVGRDDLGPPLVAELLDDLGELVADDVALPDRVGQDVLEVGDDDLELVQPVDDLLPLQGGQPAQLHVQDRLRLDLVDLQQRDQPAAGLLDVRAAADQRDDLVQRVQRLHQTAVDVRLLLGLAQAVPGPPLDDLDLVVDPVRDEQVEAERARYAVDQREHVAAEGVLQLRVLVEVVQYHARLGVTLQHDHQALTGPGRGVVADVGDAGHLAGVDQLGDLLRQVVRVDHVGQLADDQAGPALGVLLDVHHRAHRDRAAAGAVGVVDALVADDQGAVREVRALDVLHARRQDLFLGGVRVLEAPLRRGGDLAQVVRRDHRRHADRDTGRAVHQQVREPAGQDHRLLRAAVVVGAEVDRLLVDVAHHLHRQRRQPALGVPHRGRRVVTRRTEVALPLDHRRAHHPGLRQPDQGVVDRRVAVRVVLTHHVTDDARALGETAVRPVAAVVHRVEDAAVHRLEAVADLGQRAADDDGHRVVEVRLLHLRLQIERLDPVVSRRNGGLGHLVLVPFVSVRR